MPLMGIEKLYVSKNLSDISTGMSFTTPVYYKDVQELDIKPKINNASAYAENRLIDQATLFNSCDISLSRYSMSSVERAFLLGQSIANSGGTVSADTDEAPYIALLYKAPIKVNGVMGYRYGVVYKTMFTPPDETLKGLEGKPDLSQVAKIAGVAQPTEWSFIDENGKTKHPWEYHVDTTDPGCPENIEDIWFQSVQLPIVGTVSAIAVSSSTPTNNATGVALNTSPVITFNNIISNYGNILLMNITDGTLVNISKSLDATGKILTLTPSANLVTGKTYNIILSGITDIYGQVLNNQIIKFTTV